MIAFTSSTPKIWEHLAFTPILYELLRQYYIEAEPTEPILVFEKDQVTPYLQNFAQQHDRPVTWAPHRTVLDAVRCQATYLDQLVVLHAEGSRIHSHWNELLDSGVTVDHLTIPDSHRSTVLPF